MPESGTFPDSHHGRRRGRTGAAPPSSRLGRHAAQRGSGVQTTPCWLAPAQSDQVRIIAPAKVEHRLQIVTKVAPGADIKRGSRRCSRSAGIQGVGAATPTVPHRSRHGDPQLVGGPHVGTSRRVARFHRETVKSFLEVLNAAACAQRLNSPWQFVASAPRDSAATPILSITRARRTSSGNVEGSPDKPGTRRGPDRF